MIKAFTISILMIIYVNASAHPCPESSTLHYGSAARLVSASADQYVQFLRNYLSRGNSITHIYTYPFHQAGFRFAVSSGTVRRGKGANAIDVLVPADKDVARIGEDYDHGSTYYIESGETTGYWVPLYMDIAAALGIPLRIGVHHIETP